MDVSRRKIGGDGLEISVLGLGSWHTYDRIPFEDAVTLVRTAVDAGINVFDVGHYQWESPCSCTDILFGRIVSAAGLAREDYVHMQKIWLGDFPDEPLEHQLDRALLRVGTDYVDLAIINPSGEHERKPEDIDVARVAREMAELIAAGKVRGWGVNHWRPSELATLYEVTRAEGLPVPHLNQLQYGVSMRSPVEDEGFEALLDQLGMTLMPANVLVGGAITGAEQSNRAFDNPPEEIAHVRERVAPALAQAGQQLGGTPAQVAIAFSLAHPRATSVLFGAARLEHLQENIGAVALLERHGADAVRAAVADVEVSPAAH
ncbi:MAG: aldo/keto reductase [Conexibacter sp.]